MTFKLYLHQNHLEDLLKSRFLSPNPRISGLVGEICISNKFPGDADTAGTGTAL